MDIMESMKWFKKATASKDSDETVRDDTACTHLLESDNGSDVKANKKGLLPQQTATRKNPRISKRSFTVFGQIILVVLAVWGFFSLCKWSLHVAHSGNKVSCSCGGTTVAEAKARGCVFTPLAIAWLPPQCLDRKLSDQSDAEGFKVYEEGWPYWADINGTIPLTREEVGNVADIPGGVFYTTQQWHVMHCMYTWRKHYRSKATGVTIEARSNGIEHIHHCEKIVTAGHPMDGIFTMAGIELNADLA